MSTLLYYAATIFFFLCFGKVVYRKSWTREESELALGWTIGRYYNGRMIMKLFHLLVYLVTS